MVTSSGLRTQGDDVPCMSGFGLGSVFWVYALQRFWLSARSRDIDLAKRKGVFIRLDGHADYHGGGAGFADRALHGHHNPLSKVDP